MGERKGLPDLRSLGNTEQEIADALRSAGVRGRPKDAGSCPVALWLQQQYDGDPEFRPAALNNHVHLMRKGGNSRVGPEFPPPVKEFIRRFDAGDYPDLVDHA